MGRGGTASRWRGGCGGVAGRFESPSLPAVEVRGRGWVPGRSLFKRPAEAPRALPALAAQTCRAGLAPSRVRQRQWVPGPSGCGPRAPSRSRAPPPPPAASPLRVSLALPGSRSLSSALSRSLSFFPSAAAAVAAAAPPGARISAGCARCLAPAPLPSQRGALGRTPLPGAASPARPARTLGSAAAGAGLAALPASLALAGAAAARRALRGGSGGAAACSSPLRPGLRAAPRPARSAASAPPAAARAPGAGRTEDPAAASLRPRGGRARSRPLAAAQTSPARGELWPAGNGQRGQCPPASGARAAAGTPGSGRWPLTSSRAPGCPEEGRRPGALGAGGRGPGLEGLPSGLGLAFRMPPREGMGQRAWGKVSLCVGVMSGSPGWGAVPALRWGRRH